MGDDGTIAKGTRYTPEFRVKAVRLLTESRSSYSPETKAKSAGDERPGRGPGDAAPLVQPGGRDGHGGDEAIGAGSDVRAQETAPGGRRVAPGERDIDDGVGFFRGQARPDTPLMVAYVDEHKGRFEVGPICRGPVGIIGLRFHHAARLPHVQKQAREPHGRAPRGLPGRGRRGTQQLAPQNPRIHETQREKHRITRQHQLT